MLEKIKRNCREDALEEEDIEKLIGACSNKLEKLIIIGLIYTGMRVSEFSHFKAGWIKWQNNIIQIPSQMPCSCPECRGSWKPKSKNGARIIPIIDERLRAVLRNYFTLYDDIKMHRSTIFRKVREIASRTDIKNKVYPHSLRATFATMLAYKGVSAGTLMTVLGWGRIDTAQHYIQKSGIRAIEELREKW